LRKNRVARGVFFGLFYHIKIEQLCHGETQEHCDEKQGNFIGPSCDMRYHHTSKVDFDDQDYTVEKN